MIQLHGLMTSTDFTVTALIDCHIAYHLLLYGLFLLVIEKP